MRATTAFLLLFITGCSATHGQPKSICDVPTSAGWSGTEVRWHGVVVGEPHHGFALIAEDCQRRGIALDGFGDSALGKAINDSGFKTGLLRASVSGKIVGREVSYRLLISNVHRVAFEPMNEAAYYEYW